MRKPMIMIGGLLVLTGGLTGCIAATAAGAGYVVGDEVNEEDGEFDPLEDVRNEAPDDN